MFGIRHEIAYENVKYEITKQLNGEMLVTQTNRTIKEGSHGSIISTKQNTKVEIDLYDPYCKLNIIIYTIESSYIHNIGLLMILYVLSFQNIQGFLCNADTTMSYYWFINDTNYGSTNDTSFEYTFSDPGLSTVEVLVLAKIANPDKVRSIESSKDNDSFENTVRNSSSFKEVSRLESPPFVKNGLFRKHIDSRSPITTFNYTGKDQLYMKY